MGGLSLQQNEVQRAPSVVLELSGAGVGRGKGIPSVPPKFWNWWKPFGGWWVAVMTYILYYKYQNTLQL